MATTQDKAAAAQTPDPKGAGNDQGATADATQEAEEASSTPDVIECTTIKQFYSNEGALVEVGQAYVWKYDKLNQVFPWPILRPNDEKLLKPCEEEYKRFKRNKLETSGRVAERNALLARLAEVGVD